MKVVVVILISLIAIPFLNKDICQADWTYTVKRGDTLYRIAQKTGLTANEIRERTGLNRNELKLGERLIIPSSSQGVNTQVPASGNINLLAHLIQGEAANEPYIGKVAVGSVVMNRIQHPRFPKTIAGVIYQPLAFESVSNGIFNRPVSAESLRAATDAVSGWDPSGGALYFFNPAKTNNPWIWARNIITQIGRHVFAR
jgi:spore germination cell wall hydrolase CwlJ-like protein